MKWIVVLLLLYVRIGAWNETNETSDYCAEIEDANSCLEACCGLCNNTCMSPYNKTCNSTDLFIYPWEVVTDCYPFEMKTFLWIVASISTAMGLTLCIYCLRHYRETIGDEEDEDDEEEAQFI